MWNAKCLRCGDELTRVPEGEIRRGGGEIRREQHDEGRDGGDNGGTEANAVGSRALHVGIVACVQRQWRKQRQETATASERRSLRDICRRGSQYSVQVTSKKYPTGRSDKASLAGIIPASAYGLLDTCTVYGLLRSLDIRVAPNIPSDCLLRPLGASVAPESPPARDTSPTSSCHAGCTSGPPNNGGV